MNRIGPDGGWLFWKYSSRMIPPRLAAPPPASQRTSHTHTDWDDLGFCAVLKSEIYHVTNCNLQLNASWSNCRHVIAMAPNTKMWVVEINSEIETQSIMWTSPTEYFSLILHHTTRSNRLRKLTCKARSNLAFTDSCNALKGKFRDTQQPPTDKETEMLSQETWKLSWIFRALPWKGLVECKLKYESHYFRLISAHCDHLNCKSTKASVTR